ncbi:MAG: hypothetical protein QG614_580 [Patescibacteria group bacterium]|jgi:hypothetical protein|nr:hypothetical protein [Patescibacteria group bacterium]
MSKEDCELDYSVLNSNIEYLVKNSLKDLHK